ncbi:hypothetical protein [Tardiphaga sp.]|uniref:hypothetical protein n=1 Tax=Tardiphaga sp. TaxID=1926292 RepID=UPI00352A247C
MSDNLVRAILVLGIVIIGSLLIYGLRSGTMSAAGVPYARYVRSEHPIMFWLAATFNAGMAIGAIALIHAGLSNT